jgi:hypothetical protein
MKVGPGVEIPRVIDHRLRPSDSPVPSSSSVSRISNIYRPVSILAMLNQFSDSRG